MKKIVFLISLLFTMVCYAAPPPDPVPIAVDEVSFVADQVQNVVFSDYTLEVQEVAVVDIGNAVTLSAGNDMFIENLPKAPGFFSPTRLNELLKPPLLQRGAVNYSKNLTKQHCNYGYPFTAN